MENEEVEETDFKLQDGNMLIYCECGNVYIINSKETHLAECARCGKITYIGE